LKLAQVWAIYSDLQSNPLHEPPSARVIDAGKGLSQIALFDGQHKTIASWMSGFEAVTVKIYLDLSKSEANFLVNSIQAKIKKLPLSPFELSAKLSDEWLSRLEDYQAKVDPDEASEAGFIHFVDSADRSRAKSAFEAALMRALISAPELTLTKYVALAGQPKTPDALLTETQFNNKVLKRLLHTAPLTEAGELGEELRGRERDNIIRALNILQEVAFEPQEKAVELNGLERERRRRLLYQASLAYVSDLIKALHRQVLVVDPERAFLDKTPTDEQEALIREGIVRIMEHPIWTTDFSFSDKTRSVEDALSKNQDVTAAFGAVGLKLGYVVGADKLPNSWAT